VPYGGDPTGPTPYRAAAKAADQAEYRTAEEIRKDLERVLGQQDAAAKANLKKVDKGIDQTAREGAKTRGENARAERQGLAQEQRADAEWAKTQQAQAEAAQATADAEIQAQNIIERMKEILGSEDEAEMAAKISRAFNLAKSGQKISQTEQLAGAAGPRPLRQQSVPEQAEVARVADDVRTEMAAQPEAPEDLSWVQEELEKLPNIDAQPELNPRIAELSAQFDPTSEVGKAHAAKFMELVRGGLDPDEAFHFTTTGQPLAPGAARPAAAAAPPPSAPITGGTGMFTQADLPPLDARPADWLKEQPWFASLPPERRHTLYKELGGLQSEARKIMPDPSEGGFIDPRLAGRLGGAAAGAAGGASQGETPGERLGYGALGAVGGFGAARGLEELLPAVRNLLGRGATPEVGQAPFTGAPGADTPTATFIGFQETMDGGRIPLYNIKGGPRNNSTVSETTLREMGIEVPPPDPGGESGAVNTDVLSTLWKAYPSARALIGGTAGYNSSEEHPYTGALLGALGGIAAAPRANAGGINALNYANRGMYESMLAGPAQMSNILGNASTLLTTPFLEGSRGNIQGGLEGFRALAELDNWKQAARGLKTGFMENRPVKYTNELPLGPSGRTLNAVDRATKDMLEAGGMAPEMAAHYTLTEDPVTDLGKGLQMIQRVPGVGLLTPFIRTIVKQMELGAAHSPLRHMPNIDGSRPLAETFPVSNRLGVSKPWMNPFEYTAMLPGTVAAILGYHGIGSPSPNIAAAYGGLSAPYQVGRGFHDAAQYGQDSPSSKMRSFAEQIPIAADLNRLIESPENFPGRIAQRFVPPSLLSIGDPTQRDPRADEPIRDPLIGMDWNVEGYLKERLPWERESLPPRHDFFGQPQQRNWFGGAAEPLYVRDPRAAALAEMGLLRRAQSPNLGNIDLTRGEGAELQRLRGENMMNVMGPFLDNPNRIPEVPDLLADLPPVERQLLEEQLPAGVPQSQADIYRILQQRGINLGTLMFRMQRLQQQAQGLTVPPTQ
jgi:hypothetical protein